MSADIKVERVVLVMRTGRGGAQERADRVDYVVQYCNNLRRSFMWLCEKTDRVPLQQWMDDGLSDLEWTIAAAIREAQNRVAELCAPWFDEVPA